MDIGHDNMPIIYVNFYGGSVPFAAVADNSSTQDLADGSGPASGSVVTFTSVQGELQFVVIPSGGSGSYTFSWAVNKNTENSDTGNRFSVASLGTTNTSTYNDLTMNGARPASAGLVYDGDFDAVCTVSDGVAADITVTFPFQVVAAAL